MKKAIVKVYIYTRVSTAMQIDGSSLEAQRTRMKAFAEFNGYEIAGEYEDAGKSGKSIEGRPAFTQMINDIKEGKIIPGVLNSSSVDGDRLVNTVFTGIPELNSSTREAKYSALNLLIQYKNSGITETKLNEALNAAAEKGDYDDLREIENTLKNVLNGPNAKAFKDQLSALGKYYSMLDSFNQNKKSQTMMGYNN